MRQGGLISWIKLNSANKRYFDEYCEIWITARASSKDPGYNFNEGFWKFKQRIKADEVLRIGFNRTNLFKIIASHAAIFIIAFSLSWLLFYYSGKLNVPNPAQSISELIVPKGFPRQIHFVRRNNSYIECRKHIQV